MKTVISIIIPIYNKKEYIKNCVAVLLNQDFKNYEIILIDDGSTDGSGEIVDCLAYENENIRVYHQCNQGVAVARNVGLNLARGEWIWFVDADDVPSDIWLRKMEPYFESNRYDIIFSDFFKVFTDGHEELVSTGIIGEVCGDDLSCYYMEQEYTTGYFGYLWCKLIRKSYIQACKAVFVKGLTLAEDLKFLVELYKNKPKCFFTNDIAYRYTVDAFNSSKEKPIDYKAQLDIHFDVYLWIKDTKFYEQYQHILKKHISYYMAFVFFYGFEQNDNLDNECKWLLQHPEYRACLETEQMKGIMKFLVFLLKNKLDSLIMPILKTRITLRNIYRKVVKK